MRDYKCAALCETMRERGRELLKISVKYPVFGEYPQIDAFYKDLGERCFKYAKETLWAAVREEFTAGNGSANGEKRRRSPKRAALYSVVCQVTRYDDEYLSLYLEFTQAGENEVENYRRVAQTWRLSECTLLPLSEFVRPRGKNRGLDREDYYLRGDSAVVFTSGFRPGTVRRRWELPGVIKEREIAIYGAGGGV